MGLDSKEMMEKIAYIRLDSKEMMEKNYTKYSRKLRFLKKLIPKKEPYIKKTG